MRLVRDCCIDIRGKHQDGNTVEEITTFGNRREDDVDRMGEDRWRKIAWNYKPTG